MIDPIKLMTEGKLPKVPEEQLDTDFHKWLLEDKDLFVCPILFNAGIKRRKKNPEKIDISKTEALKSIEDCETCASENGCFYKEICASYQSKKFEMMEKERLSKEINGVINVAK